MTRSRAGIAAVGAVIVAGAVLAWLSTSRSDDAPSPQAELTAERSDDTAPPPAGRTAPAGSRTVSDDLDGEVRRVQGDPAYLQRLLAMYASATDLDTRGALLAVLRSAAADNEEILRFALGLADSSDPDRRQDGLALLEAYPLDNAEVRKLLTRQIEEETDPAMLGRLVGMLEAAVVPTEDAAPVVEQLGRLREHPDPEVRAASVTQSVSWDKGSDLENILHRAILDAAPQVRQAAIGGVTASGVRSPRLKDALLAIAADPGSGADERFAAVLALQDFPLDRAEYAIYSQAARMIDDDDSGSHGGHGH
ncbi:HEAT repeat domain-containing protein [Marilutibacter chinensis]|uniref:HEAT repeat domain-containing protein n=1 Tax=Marilutibacter chinensis TaxID=2912247 RepID=A0ABS9HS93_9GAMM|nr:HEAT repeat domain-containing protein [Lysobacter chinensis]MCF7221381.1 HEAT repeat domain-containing protein [Lysobacter chinensis]